MRCRDRVHRIANAKGALPPPGDSVWNLLNRYKKIFERWINREFRISGSVVKHRMQNFARVTRTLRRGLATLPTIPKIALFDNASIL